MQIYLLTFAAAFFVTYLLTPVVRTFALKWGAVDIPNNRKIHTKPIPRLGGVAISLGFFSAVIFALIWANYSGSQLEPTVIAGIILGSLILLIVGIIDDVKPLRATVKLFFQIIAALIIICFGVEISFVSNPFNGIMALGFFTIPITLLWVVGLTNAINLIDGLDGLATGVTAISAMTLFFVAIRTHQIGAAILMLALAGAALGFLRYNFNPASIFLGDSGSLFLGFVLASAAITGVFKSTLVVALIIPVLILGVPIFDTLFAIGRRLSAGKHPFVADDKHIHHILLRAGLNKREVVLSIYIACFILSFIALIMALQR